jgi:high-affinity nickel permease
MPTMDLVAAIQTIAPTGGTITLLTTALLLGVRHGIDWDHIAAITDITSTAATAADELPTATPDAEMSIAGLAVSPATEGTITVPRSRFVAEQRHGIVLGTLYALGHASVVVALGLAALAFGALLPDWVDPIMSRIVGVTLIVLGVWVFYSVYAHMRHGTAFRLRSRWMLAFDWVRYSWRWLGARIHGHDHIAPLESSTYGPRTAFGVGMIHGVGAETGTQVLIIAAVGGAASVGLGVPMMLAFVVGLLISNTAIVFLTASGFVAGQLRQRIYLVLGLMAGLFSLFVGLLLVMQADGLLPDLGEVFGFIGGGS